MVYRSVINTTHKIWKQIEENYKSYIMHGDSRVNLTNVYLLSDIALIGTFLYMLVCFSYVEKSQVLMEQRNEGLLSSANQNQNRVLSLEQDKVSCWTMEVYTWPVPWIHDSPRVKPTCKQCS